LKNIKHSRRKSLAHNQILGLCQKRNMMMDSEEEPKKEARVSETTHTPHAVYHQHESQVARELKNLTPYINPPVSNPAPLGLFAFAITTALLQVEHAKLAGDNTSEDLQGVSHLVWGFAIFYGGLLQVIAGLCEFRRNNILGYTAFLSYGGFWMSLGLAHIVLMLSPNESITAIGINLQATQAMLVMFGLLTGVFWICSFAVNATICTLFFLLMVLFFLLAGGTVNATCDVVAGYVGFATAFNAFWLATAEIINDILGRGKPIIPLGQFKRNPFKFAGGFHAAGRTHGVTQHAALYNSEFGPHRRRSSMALARFRESITKWSVKPGAARISVDSSNDEEAPPANA
jgi:succinate-acetate transporter protein